MTSPTSEGDGSDDQDLAEDWDDMSEVDEEGVGEDGETNADGDIANGKKKLD